MRSISIGTPIFALALAVGLSTAACKSEIDDKPAAKTEKAAPEKAEGDKAEGDKADGADGAEEAKIALAADKSKVGFIGAKKTADHKGSFGEISGEATMVGNEVTGFWVSVKVASMTTDADDLTKHLMGADFFDAEQFPEAKFTALEITPKAGENGATHEIAGNLEMHGQTNKITFPATVEVGATGIVGKADFKINRKDWGIVYAGMPDDLIKDDVALQLDLTFPRA